jgi:hypothetical protein
MKMITVRSKIRNVMTTEFRHCVKSKLIEVMIKTMQMIQFMSIVTLIQIQLMNNMYGDKNLIASEIP